VTELIVNYCMSVLSILRGFHACDWLSPCRQAGRQVGRMSMTQQFYWLIMNHGCTLPYDWLPYTMLAENGLAECLVCTETLILVSFLVFYFMT
jgi:hypothetical protein